MPKRWRVMPVASAEVLSVFASPSPKLAQILWNRGLRTAAEAADFFSPSWENQLHAPQQFRQIKAAADVALQTLAQGERLTVHGDYDADGITGSAVLITTLQEIERTLFQRPRAASCVDFYIPHRDKEGYGLHRETVAKLKERGTRLMITVDCGIACVDEIALAKQAGMTTIVVDHHQFNDALPDGYLIHPGLPDETYPFKKLAAVGVAFKFACVLLEEACGRGATIPAGWEKWLLDLVAIATVTDMVPLVGENRLLESYGLRVLNQTRRIGLRALIDSAGLTLGELDAESIGFAIGPRLNAAGRMDHATLALRLLLSQDEIEARQLAIELEERNSQRQAATKQMMAEAEQIVAVTAESSIMVLWNKAWSPALVGLVAGRFLEKYGRPVIAIGYHDGKWIGSGRSFATFDITTAVKRAGEGILTRAGGHVQACGFSLPDDNALPELARRLAEYAKTQVQPDDLIPTLDIDLDIAVDDVDLALAKQLDRLAPFGEGNRCPTFLSRRCLLQSVDLVGSQKNHLRVVLGSPSGRRLKGIGFKLGESAPSLVIGDRVDVVYHVSVNTWQDRQEVQAKLIDIKKSSYAS